MKNKILNKQWMRNTAVLFLVLFGAGFVMETSAQTRTPQPRPVPRVVVTKPVVTPGTGTGVSGATGTGVGGATGAGAGAATGNGVGAPSGSAMGTPNQNATGGATGSGTGTNTGSSTGLDTARPVLPRTYIKEMNGRCYYVTTMGAKRYVARRQCALYP